MYWLLFVLGQGANAMVYEIEYQNISYAMKISNENSKKEYKIVQKMEKYINRKQIKC